MDYLMLVDKFNPIDMGFYDRVELTEVNGKVYGISGRKQAQASAQKGGS